MQSAQVGSDSAIQWTALFCIACLALVAPAIWTVLDRGRRRYDRIQPWVWAVLRLVLAAAMFYFGMAKVIPTQRPFMLNRLVDRTGISVPPVCCGRRSGYHRRIRWFLGCVSRACNSADFAQFGKGVLSF